MGELLRHGMHNTDHGLRLNSLKAKVMPKSANQGGDNKRVLANADDGPAGDNPALVRQSVAGVSAKPGVTPRKTIMR